MKLKHRLAVACMAGFLGAGSAMACPSEPFVGQVCAFAFSFCPQGFAEANGNALAIRENPTLFSVLGTNFGGDGKTTFGLPDLRGREIIPAESAGEVGGNEKLTMTTTEIPPHDHELETIKVSLGKAGPEGTSILAVGGSSASQSGMASKPSGDVVATTSLLPPQTGVTFCIATVGVYPQRP